MLSYKGHFQEVKHLKIEHRGTTVLTHASLHNNFSPTIQFKEKQNGDLYIPPHLVHPSAPVQQNASSLVHLALLLCQVTCKPQLVTFHTAAT